MILVIIIATRVIVSMLLFRVSGCQNCHADILYVVWMVMSTRCVDSVIEQNFWAYAACLCSGTVCDAIWLCCHTVARLFD